MSTLTDDNMKEYLLSLGFSKKEVEVYLALLEFGMQPASQIAKQTNQPKSTVLFLFDNLVKKGIVRRTNRGHIQYFYADPQDLRKIKEKHLQEQATALNEVVPLLEEFKSPYSSEPKLTFYEGVDGCRKAYSLLLESKTEVLEFGAHGDLVEKLGEDFMQKFIATRVKNKVFLKAIAKKEAVNEKLAKLDKKQLRKIQFFSPKKGTLYSSIAIFENKVLLLNLYRDAFAIIIENQEVSETLKTIFRLSWKA